jgi:hypothetical protein
LPSARCRRQAERDVYRRSDPGLAGCEWLFVDFEPHLETFYLESCGFRPTLAGLVHLTDT